MKSIYYFKLSNLLLTGILLSAIVSCKKMDSTYSKFIVDGALIYPGKVDSVYTGAGNGRIQLKWKVPFDNNIVAYKIFWNFGSDSLLITGNRPDGNDSVKMTINNLQEGSYGFSVHTYDKEGRRSVAAKAVARAYGAIFMSTIYNRPIRTSVKNVAASTLTITWVGLDLNCIGTEWLYTKSDGTAGQFFSPIAGTTVITDCKVTEPITYRSVFIPEPKSIDKFYTGYNSL